MRYRNLTITGVMIWRLALLAPGFLCIFPFDAAAAGVVLRIMAANPLTNQPQKAEIRTSLPPQIRPEHVKNTAGLDLSYDVRSDLYYVHKEIELGPGEIRPLDIELDDIWAYKESDLVALEEQAKRLAGELSSTKFAESAKKQSEDVGVTIKEIRERQAKYSMQNGATAMDHIRAHEANAEVMKHTKLAVGELENQVFGLGKDPGSLLGEARGVPPPERRLQVPTNQMRTAVFMVKVQNPSPSESKKVNIFRLLPPELAASDVVDPGGLQVGTDFKTRLCYLAKESVELAPSQTVTYTAIVLDRWNVNKPRIGLLRGQAEELRAAINAREKRESVEKMIGEVVEGLTALDAEEGPKELNDAYVAFYRAQANKLDELENKLNRVRTVLRPVEKTTKLGFKGKPPSAKSTWMIIYIILGFLGVMSLLFFLRWYGRGKEASEVQEAPPQS